MRKFDKILNESGESCVMKPTRQDGDNSLCVGHKEDDTDAKFQMVKHALALVSSSEKNRTCERDEWVAKFINKTITLPEQNRIRYLVSRIIGIGLDFYSPKMMPQNTWWNN